MRRGWLTLVVTTAVTTACAAPRVQPNLAGRTVLRSEMPARAPCPLGMTGATVAAEDRVDGVDVIFTSKDDTIELRERVAAAAAQHGPLAHAGRGHDGRHGRGGRHGLQTASLPPVSLRAVDVDDGARLQVVPKHEGDLAGVRAQVHERVAKLATSPCDDD
jgi:hypothetical protein